MNFNDDPPSPKETFDEDANTRAHLRVLDADPTIAVPASVLEWEDTRGAPTFILPDGLDELGQFSISASASDLGGEVKATSHGPRQPNTYTALDTAHFFLRVVDVEAGDLMTNLRLQKLVYYAQAWHLALNDRQLFADRIEAWVHGPVVPSLYDNYKAYGWHAINTRGAYSMPEFTRDTQSVLNDVWATYGQYSAKHLEELTHSEDPWLNARKGYEPGERCTVEIEQEDMRRFYAAQALSSED